MWLEVVTTDKLTCNTDCQDRQSAVQGRIQDFEMGGEFL